jgi:ribose-phosphate pyrophosphokinase
MVSSLVDWLVTVDPHLHRYGSLSEIYSVPARVVRAAPLLSAWIKTHVSAPLLIGPDVESEQWVSEVANAVGAPYKVLRKVRKGDRTVEIEMPDLGAFSAHTPVLVDDIVSSAKTMIEAAGHLAAQGMRPPVCLAVHGLFSGAAFDELAAKASTVVTTNSVPHPSNAIDIAPAISTALRDLVGAFAAPVENQKEERA